MNNHDLDFETRLELRKTALEAALRMRIESGTVSSSVITQTADSIYQWLIA